MLKIMTIIGTRPEIIKLSRVINELDKYTNQIIVHSGQNYDYELNEIFFRDLEIRKPNYFLDAAKANPIETIANVLVKIDRLLEIEKPDAILIYGDTNTCLSVIAAKRRKIPVFHMEAGNRCFDLRVPEELNRKIVDHLSDINFTLTEHARKYLESEGLRPETIIKSGSSMKEVFKYNIEKINESNILERLKLDKKDYFVVSAHREENLDIDNNFIELLSSLNKIAKHYGKKIIFSTHPRTRKKIDSIDSLELDERIIFLKPLGFFDYIKLQMNAFCTLSDSGTITEESSILGFPAITIRNAHERPEGMDEGTLIMSGLSYDRMKNAIDIVVGQADEGCMNIVKDYDSENVSKKIVRCIVSYTDYINRTIWHKK
ncbi:UDP-N-acetylglucosamine 2-epimerase (non-hydrolyzing) [Romboutsia sedimentorum]|uniref:non-hydrolyzing UDP-N-acetylglucosamine 2-epimerase n=1 Tax=Romboutsia sedimentorum TaxID=1368474 RepID=UPI0024DE627B|nr:UDP-N-acetylglucosamine 2-epimerase (non-hydrolyzing) [Romboutsia sedimentorum]MDK2585822.1 UDP-N-acetylglucosamine 2-epimerase (non-hydrolyzing) [Romboutsia sedimentorum]